MVIGSDFLTKILSVLSFRLGMVIGSVFSREKTFQGSVFGYKRCSVTIHPCSEYSNTFFGLLQETRLTENRQPTTDNP